MKYLQWAFYMLCIVIINAPGWCWAKLRGRPFTPIGGGQ